MGVQADKETVERAQDGWIAFTRFTTWSVITVIAVLALMAIFLL